MFSKTCQYELKAILHIALSGSEFKKVRGAEISKALNLPEPFLAKILQVLVKNHIVTGVKGPNGGFYINSSSKKIPLINVIEIFDGKTPFTNCGMGLKECSETHPCPIHKEFRPYRNKLYKLLSKKTIKQFSTAIKSGKTFISNPKLNYTFQ